MDIQFLALAVINDYLLKEERTQQIVDRITFYMEVAHRHKAIALKVMADALVYSEGLMDEEQYEKFRSYVIMEARNNLRYVKDNYEQFYKKYKESEGEEKVKYHITGFHLSNLTKEAEYVRVLLGDPIR